MEIQLHGHHNIIIDVVTSSRQHNIIPIIIFIIVKILLLCGHLYCKPVADRYTFWEQIFLYNYSYVKNLNTLNKCIYYCTTVYTYTPIIIPWIRILYYIVRIPWNVPTILPIKLLICVKMPMSQSALHDDRLNQFWDRISSNFFDIRNF